MKTNKIIDIFIYFIILIKILFLLTVISNYILSNYYKNSQTSKLLEEKNLYWKNIFEFIFTISTAILLIFIFSPRHNNQIYINKEMTLLFYMFGFVLIITSKWEIFFKEAKWYKELQHIVK
jgi:hypothetical protein